MPFWGIVLDVLPSLQFTEYHKFLVSAGGLSVGLSAALPLFLLRNQKILELKAEDVAKLNSASQKALSLQQGQILWLLETWPLISGSLMIVGLVLILHGAIVWRGRQAILNSREDAEIKRINAEEQKFLQEAASFMRAHQISVDEKIDSAEEELREAESGSLDALESAERQQADKLVAGEEPSERATGPDVIVKLLETNPRRVSGVLDYFATEEQLIEKLSEQFGGKVEVARGVRFKKLEVDAVFTSLTSALPSLILEVKALSGSRRSVQEKCSSSMDLADRASLSAWKMTGKMFRPVVVFVLPDGMTEVARMHARTAIDEILNAREKMAVPPITVIAVQRKNIDRLAIDPGWLALPNHFFHWHE
jgi:hypothetical protein